MKITIIAILSLLLLSSCNDNRQVLEQKAKAIREVFPGGRVFTINPEGNGNMLYVVDTLGNLYEISTSDFINTQLNNVRKGIEIR